eukprot:jgi/Chlat1/2534/Chrsp175S02386
MAALAGSLSLGECRGLRREGGLVGQQAKPWRAACRPLSSPSPTGTSSPSSSSSGRAAHIEVVALVQTGERRPKAASTSAAAGPARRGDAIRLALPSKGRMAEDTLALLNDCQLSVRKANPRQYIAAMPEMEGVEVWFQRASDVVRKLRTGDVDFGIVGNDMVAEIGEGDSNLMIIHDALDFGHCHLALAIPMHGKFADVNSWEELAAMPDWTPETPMRVVTGYMHVGEKFFADRGFKHVALLTADGALEAAPAMGTADLILDLVSTGVTLRENNLKQITGGRVLDSQAVLVANRRTLESSSAALEVAHELIERLEAHLRAAGQFSVTANVRGRSAEQVAAALLAEPALHGLQGPTVAPVYAPSEATDGERYFAATICVPKRRLYSAVKQLRHIGGSGVLVAPLTYIFEEEPPRWRAVLDALGH